MVSSAEDYMNEALAEAENAVNRGDGPFGAIVVNPDGEIVSRGSCRVASSNDPTAHAEINAIRGLCKSTQKRSFEGFSVYSTTEPCVICMSTCLKVGITSIFYGAEHQKNSNLIIRAKYIAQAFKKSEITLVGGILEKDCLIQREKAGII